MTQVLWRSRTSDRSTDLSGGHQLRCSSPLEIQFSAIGGGPCNGGASGICDLAFFCHVPVGIDLREALPSFWKIFDGEDCRYRADWDAGTAVNAFIGIDVKLRCSRKLGFVFTWMNTVTRADVHARCILCAHTRFGNYVCHSILLGVTEREARPILYPRATTVFS